MDGSQFNPRQLNPSAPRFARQNTGIHVSQQADGASLQANFEQQLNQLQPGSSGESAGGRQSTHLGVSRPVPSLPDLRDNFVTCDQTSEAAHGPGPGPNSGKPQPEFAVNKEVRVGAKRDRSEPFPEDKELVSTFKKVAIEAKMNEWTVLKLGNVLHHLSHWLRQENRQPIFGRFNPDSPRHASFVADVKDYLKAGGRPAIVTQLNKVAPGSLPSREHLTGKLPAEDVNLLTRFRLDAEQRNIATKATVDGILSGFRQFALWLQHNNKGSLASQLQGGSLDKEISEYRAPGRDAQNRLTTTLANLQRFLPGPQQAKRLQSPAIGRPRKLAPHPEDAPLIEGALGQTLKDLGAPTAEQRVSAQMRATRLRGLSDWLRSEGKGSIADRLNGSKQEKLRLDVVAFQRTGKRIPSADLSHLRNYLKLIEANRDLRLQAREQSALPAVLDAGRPSPSQELPATAQSERAGTFLGEVMQECASPSTAKAPPGGYQVIPPHADLRDDAHFAPAHSAGVRSGTFGGLEPFVDLNAPTPSDLRDDAHFAPAHSARARSGTFGGLQSFVDLNAPTPSDLRDDAQSAPVRPRGGQMFGDVEPQPLMQGTGSAADLRPGGADDVQNIHRDRLSPQPALPVTAWLPDTYRGLPLVDVTMPTTSSSDALIGRVASSNVPAGSVLGATDWLSDAHIQRDYHLLEEQLLGIDPTLAARTRLVDPSVSNLLRQIERQDAEATLQSIYDQNDAPADFLFLPVNNGTPAHEGTHWSLLLVDRRNPQRHVAYHYDSLQRGQYNDAPATQLAGLLDATLVPARIAQQPNKFDCGVFVVDGTRALVERLVDGQRPDHAPLHLDNLVADRQALQNRLREERLPHEPAAIPAEAFLPAGSQVQHAVLQEQQARQIAPAPFARHLAKTREAQDELTSTLDRSNLVSSGGMIINNEHYTALLIPAKRQRTDNPQSLAMGRRQALQNRLKEERLPHEPAAIHAEAILPAGSQVQHAVLQEQQARQIAPAPFVRHLGKTREAQDELTSTLDRSNLVSSGGMIINNEHCTALLVPAKRQRTDNPQSLAMGRQLSEATTTSISQASDQARADLIASFRSRERSAGR